KITCSPDRVSSGQKEDDRTNGIGSSLRYGNTSAMVISSVPQFSAHIETLFPAPADVSYIYRGHGATSFALRPKVGRVKPPENSGRATANEKLMLELFR